MSSVSPHSASNGSDHCSAENSAGGGENASQLSREEARQLRAEKLQAVQKAIADGKYDSDEILTEAVRRMHAAMESGKSVPPPPA